MWLLLQRKGSFGPGASGMLRGRGGGCGFAGFAVSSAFGWLRAFGGLFAACAWRIGRVGRGRRGAATFTIVFMQPCSARGCFTS